MWCVIIKPGKLSPFIKRNGIFSSQKIELRKKRPSFFIAESADVIEDIKKYFWLHKVTLTTMHVFCLIELMFLVNKCKFWLHEQKKTPYLVRVSYVKCPARYIRRLFTQRSSLIHLLTLWPSWLNTPLQLSKSQKLKLKEVTQNFKYCKRTWRFKN